MSQLRRDDAGNTGATFYQVTLQPGNWYKWFRTPKDGRSSDRERRHIDTEPEGSDEEPENYEKEEPDDDSGWTEVYTHF